MYTSTYSSTSSPIRTAVSETTETNCQHQSFHRQYNQSSYSKNTNTINDSNMNLRRNNDGFSHSIPSLISSNPLTTPTSSRRYLNNYNNIYNDSNRYQSTAYSPSPNRSYRNDNETFRPDNTRYNLSNNNRAYSYDDLHKEQNRLQSSIRTSRNTDQYRQPIIARGDQYNYRDDDEDEDLIVKSTDLSARYEQDMIQLVRTGFRKYDITNQRELAGFLKRAADSKFSPCWHCIVGRQFSSYVTHEMSGFIYFTRGPLSILLFKSGA
ncbi:unnamed protein product [Rotaria socialis]|uniref:Dynein light chain 1, cytoplasmic n=1 Tax=Rotaria socialis TaxID=392032 RepID=A0A820I1V1_9BILA|nr:unnamed protein product [Rotaria socialis]CAF3304034.1 unnamed protein product [Rotaria socialis]CAF3307047.1 unnamed protein product [Rotaria socialis]CAF3419421.1 unnamed protein product [Rotaria socialis]CAF3569582.1 unnamed protein product [Rotaria socialis]